jgi:hypothetical protein
MLGKRKKRGHVGLRVVDEEPLGNTREQFNVRFAMVMAIVPPVRSRRAGSFQI